MLINSTCPKEATRPMDSNTIAGNTSDKGYSFVLQECYWPMKSHIPQPKQKCRYQQVSQVAPETTDINMVSHASQAYQQWIEATWTSAWL